MAIRLDNFDKLIRGDLDYIRILTDNFTCRVVAFLLLDGLSGSKRDHLAQISQFNYFHIFLLIFYHVLGMLRICLHRLLENLLDVCIFKIRFIFVNFLGHFNLSLSQNVQILSLFTLLVEYVAAITNCILDIFY